MKKYNVLVIILSILIMTALANLIGFIIGLIVGKEGLYILWMILATFCAWSFYPVYMNPLLILFVKRTMKKHSEEEGFGKAYTYTNKNTGTCGCVLAIDESSGRVAYVSALNPFQFQMCHANDLTDLQSSYIKGPFGGTRYVYFTFCYKNKGIKIPTFTSRNMFSVGSSLVQDGLAKGQKICDMISRLQKLPV